MKSIIAALALILLTANADAQLLRKLKEKTEKALEQKAVGNNAPAAGSTGASPDNSAAPASQPAGTRPGGDAKLVFTLAPDERLLYDESRVMAYNQQLQYQFVLQNRKYDFFLVDNGVRTGPFKSAPQMSRMAASTRKDDEQDEINLGNDRKDPVTLQYSKTIGGKLHIVFNGKNYGPYDYVSKILVSPDQKKFFAAVTMGGQTPMMAQMGMGNLYIVNESGLKMQAGEGGMSIPLRLTASEGFKHALVMVMDQQTQKVLTLTTAGKQEEGSMADLYAGNNARSMLTDQGDIISIPAQSPTQLLVNGQEVAQFKVPLKNRERLYLAPVLSKSVYYEEGMLYRGDGSAESLKGVLFPNFVTLNNESFVYYFQIYEDENGSKEVYLCRKAL